MSASKQQQQKKREYRVKYDFHAEEATELEVNEGDIVKAAIGSEKSSDPWTLVECVEPPFNRGFIPTSYLEPYINTSYIASVPDSGKKSAPVSTSSTAISPPRTSGAQHQVVQLNSTSNNNDYASYDPRSGGPIRRLSDPRLPHQLLETLSINPPEEHLPSFNNNANGSSPRNQNVIVRKGLSLAFGKDEYAQLFASHDRMFQQVMHQRHDQLRSLDESAGDIIHRLEASRAKAQQIAESMVEVNALIEDERRRWKEKLNETKMEIYQNQ